MMKKITALLIVILLSGCSDYPTSGKLIQDDETESWFGEVSHDKYSGFIVELEPNLIDEINKIKAVIKSNNNSKKDFKLVTKLPLLNGAAIDKINSDYQMSLTSRDKTIQDKIDEWKSNKEKEVKVLETELIQIGETKTPFDEHIAEPEKIVDKLKLKIEQNKIKNSAIVNEIIDQTNEVIKNNNIDTQLLKGNWFSLRSVVTSFKGKGPKNCRAIRANKYRVNKYPVEKYIVIDNRPDENSCTIINRPKKEVVSKEYDEFVKEKYIKMKPFSNEVHEKELKKAKKELSSATRIAENKTGTSYWRIKNEFDRVNESISNIQKATKMASFEFVEEQLSSNLYRSNSSTDYNIMVHLLELTQSLNNVGVDKYSIQNKYRKSIDTAYIGLMKEAVEKSIIKIVLVGESGKFSGLKGGFGLIALLVNIDASISKGNNTEPAKFRYSELININNENHKLAKQSDLDLVVDTKRLKGSNKKIMYTKNTITSEILNLIN